MLKDSSDVLCVMKFLYGSESRDGLTNRAYCEFNINIIVVFVQSLPIFSYTTLHGSGGRHGTGNVKDMGTPEALPPNP